ncbi:flagellar motor switch protein FliN [Nocardioides sp. Kera G14]|uniref:flagellar motor switch protein FliN n=1 Tax=Nocardioides sp. Kera G14 TaxID=2884264 RepID=UPI001D1272DC|nr:flagellar motor switch protein FliN [Nocardioides sp. Kera G14]UDY24056.1 flagellar motor switch protein FliN [Nocardioides sp. Kera G14]
MTDFTAAAKEATATAAAEAAALVMPAIEPLSAGPAQPGSPHVTAAFARAAVADLEPPAAGRVAILVGADLTNALDSGPLGGLELHVAIAPALEALCGQLGSRARNARTVDLTDVLGELGEPFMTVPLIGLGIDAAVLLNDDALTGAREPLPEEQPGPAYVDPTVASASQAVTAPLADLSVAAQTAAAQAAAAPAQSAAPFLGTVPSQRGLEMLHGVDMEVTVELGRTRMTVRDLLALSPGAVLELDRAAGSPADLLVNGRLIARGEVVVVDEDFGLRVTEILDDATASTVA